MAGVPSASACATDPTILNTMLVTSGQTVYRTQDAGSTWTSLGTMGAGCTVPGVAATATGPSSIVFVGNGGYLQRTVNANGPGTPTWTTFGSGVFPARSITSLGFDASATYSPNQGIMYAAFDGYEQNPNPNASTRHVYRSGDAGQTWADVSGAGATGLPDLPVTSVGLNPFDSNTVYAATALGVFQGTYNVTAGTATWGTLMNGLPNVRVQALVAHKESGILRAFTVGRGAWETQIFPLPNPDVKVNQTNPVTDVQSPRVSAGKGNNFSVAWIDDRIGANNWHVFHRVYGYDANANPVRLATAEYRVDDSTTHSTQALSIAADPMSELSSLCSRLAWQDDRLNVGINQHVYLGAMCSDGYKLFINDIQADQQVMNVNATVPGITFQPTKDFAVAWLTDRTAGSSMHDVYARFFDLFGSSKGNQFQVNTLAAPSGDTTDACSTGTGTSCSGPVVASDGSSNVFIAWAERVINQGRGQAVDYRVLVSKYDVDGTLLVPPVRVDDGPPQTGQPLTVRSQPTLATDNSSNIIVSWWEGYNSGPEKVTAKKCTNTLASCAYLDAGCRRCMGGSRDGDSCVTDSYCTGAKCSPSTVSCPPLVPPGAQRALAPAAATDVAGNIAIVWQGNVNAADGSSWSGFARSFDTAGAVLKNDLRVDLHGRFQAGPTRVARPRKMCIGGANQGLICKKDVDCPTSTCGSSGRFPFAWRDNRSGHFDVYTRTMPSLQ